MAKSDEIAIKVTDINKTFRLPHEKTTSIKGLFISMFRSKRTYEKQQVLKNISFDVKKGEFFGIVGRNGGGKSTLLKLLAGIYAPDSGHIQVNGKLTPFIELGVGFNPELTGRENVFLNGALLGFNRAEMEAMYDDIVVFAELEQFMDQKLKNYSSGMQVRLAFSIAIRAESEILVMDEVLAVGDAAFQRKCFDVFRELKKQGRTIILVTHDMGNVERFCDRVLIINKGEQLAVTSAPKASSIYARLNINESGGDTNDDSNRYGTGQVRVADVGIYSGPKKTNILNMGDELKIRISLKRRKGEEMTPVACGLAIFNEDGVNIMGPNSEKSAVDPRKSELIYTLPNISLTPGKYMVTIAIYDQDNFTDYFDFLERWTHFSVVADHVTHGVVELKSKWTSK